MPDDDINLFENKYNPIDFDGFLGQTHIINKIKQLVNKNMFGHSLFFGNPGLGKSTLAQIIKNEVFKDIDSQYVKNNFKYVDNHSVDNIREVVIPFMKRSPRNVPFKLVIIEEADKLSKDAQKALKDPMQKYSKNCRIILICNEVNKINDALRSSKGGRCTEYIFRPVSSKEIENRIQYICNAENFEITEDVKKEITKKSNGSPRSALKILQSYIITGEVEDDITIDYTVSPLTLLNKAFKNDIKGCEKTLTTILYKDRIEPFKYLNDMSRVIARTEFKGTSNNIIGKVLYEISDAQNKLSFGSNEVILRGLYGKLLVIGQLRRKENVKLKPKTKPKKE